MYRVEKQTHKHKKLRRTLTVLIILALLGGLVYVLMHLRIAPDQDIRNASPTSKSYATEESAKVAVDKPLFKLMLPAEWKERPVDIHLVNAPKYVFASPSEKATRLDVYIDAIPTDLGINKAVVVSAQGDGLAHDNVSENCTTFTDSKLTNKALGIAPAKWQETNFLCDMGNYNRQVVGTISNEGINIVTLTGQTGGTHKYFLTYTDNTISPSYVPFYEILGSFHAK